MNKLVPTLDNLKELDTLIPEGEGAAATSARKLSGVLDKLNHNASLLKDPTNMFDKAFLGEML